MIFFDFFSHKLYCPYCKVELEKEPTRKTKCKKCGKYYFIKTHPYKKERVIVTEKEAIEIDNIYHEEEIKTQIIELTRRIGLTEKDLKNKINKLKKKYPNKKEVINYKEAFWWLISELIYNKLKNNDFNELSYLYFTQAYFLFNIEGKNPYNSLLASLQTSLIKYKNEGYKKVKIITVGNQSYNICRKNHNKILTIDEALKKNIIPCKDCKTYYNEKAKSGWCRCVYFPVLE